MSRLIKRCSLALFFIGSLCSAEESLSLTVTFSHLQTTNGTLGVLLFNQDDGFPNSPDKALRRKRVPASSSTVTFDHLPPGSYAVSVFQDLNNNQQCDTKRFGQPLEPFGLSSYTHKPRFFPRFQRAGFQLDSPGTDITIRLYN